MATPIPWLSAADYPEFQRTCRGLPPTHLEWEFNQQNYHQNHGTGSHEIVPIPIELSEFEEYCQRKNWSPTTDALYGLATEKFTQMDRVATFRRDGRRLR
jgi:hypothetical protein